MIVRAQGLVGDGVAQVFEQELGAGTASEDAQRDHGLGHPGRLDGEYHVGAGPREETVGRERTPSCIP
jgi:hypothetical protein